MAENRKRLAPTIDELLDNIDMEFTNYTPSDLALEFFAIVRVLLGEDFEIPNKKFHYFMIDLIYGQVKREQFPYGSINKYIKINKNNVAMVLSRGLSKSTIVTLYFPIVAAIKGMTPVTGPLSNILILSDTQDGGSKSQYEMMLQMIDQNKERFKIFFEDWGWKDFTIWFVRKGDGDKKNRHMQVKFKGAITGGIRSGSRNPVTGERYAIILSDDVIAKEDDAKSTVIMNKIRSSLFSDARRAMRAGDRNLMVLINTIYSKNDPIYSIAESGTYTPLVVPICKELYEGMTAKDFKGAWPEYHTFKSVYKEYLESLVNGQKRMFMQELMCRISDEDDQLVRYKDIHWFNRNELIKYTQYFNWYVTTDFTSSVVAKKTSDYSVAMLWAASHDGRLLLWDMVVEQLGIEEQYDELFRMIDKWVPDGDVEIAIENNGNQRPHLVAIKNKMIIEDKRYMFAQQKGKVGLRHDLNGIDSRKMGKDKLDRFKLVAPLIRNGTIAFARELERETQYDEELHGMRELLNEMKYTTEDEIKAKNDDAIDGISQLSAVNTQVGVEPPEGPKKVETARQFENPSQALMYMMKAGFVESGENENTSVYSSYV